MENIAKKNNAMKILVDNGHGVNTPGKRSPDGRFREYAYTRLIAEAVVLHLQYRGFDAELLVPEEYDVCLKERVRRVNTFCEHLGKRNVLLVSIHVNAAGKGDRWYDATGWCAYTSRGQTGGDKLADALYAAAERHLAGHKIRKDYSDGDPDWESDFAILKKTACAACMTENGFQDSEQSLRYLESEAGKVAICNLHVEGICNYISNL